LRKRAPWSKRAAATLRSRSSKPWAAHARERILALLDPHHSWNTTCSSSTKRVISTWTKRCSMATESSSRTGAIEWGAGLRLCTGFHRGWRLAGLMHARKIAKIMDHALKMRCLSSASTIPGGARIPGGRQFRSRLRGDLLTATVSRSGFPTAALGHPRPLRGRRRLFPRASPNRIY